VKRAFSPRLAAIVIVLAGTAAFANSFNGVFVFDDKNAIALNPCIRTLWPLTVAMNAPRDTTLAGRPVASLSFALTYALAPADARDTFAVPANADASTVDRFQRNLWGYHAANLAIHLLTALALFGVVRRSLRAPALARRFGSRADVLALVIATIWVVHPLTTGAVTYIVQRVESLMGLFYLLTLYCAIRAADGALESPPSAFAASRLRRDKKGGHDRRLARPARRRWGIASVACCALGMGTKEAFVTAPVMVMAWDYLMLDDPWRAVFARRWPLYAGLGSTWILLAGIMAFAPRTGSVGFGLEGVSSWMYLRTQAGVIAHYLRLAFVPWPLALDYEWPIAPSLTGVLVPAVIVLSLLGATVWGVLRREAGSFAGVWFFLILAPTSSVVPIVTEVAADHRMYLPLAAIIAGIVLGVVFVAERKRARAVTATLTIVLVVALGAMTYARNADYASEERVYAQTVATRPSSARARSNLASVLIEQGRPQEAEPLLREAIRLKPDYPDAHANLGVAYVVEGRSQEALAPFERAIALAPDNVAVWRNYGEALGSLERFADAARAFRKGLSLSPDDPDLLEGLAWILATSPDARVRDGTSALDLARRAAGFSGNSPNVLDTLAAAYAENGQFADAVATGERALAVAREGGHAELVPQIELRLQLYRERQPYREGR
jgi:protein O-mannosyl-transferase